MTILKHAWYPIKISKEIKKNKIYKENVFGKDLIIYRNQDNKIIIKKRYCPHRGADMSRGSRNKNCIACPYHGWIFDDYTGNLKNIPSETKTIIDNNSISLQSIQYYDDSYILWCYYGNDESCSIIEPNISKYCDFINNNITVGFQQIKCNWLKIMENAIDPAHPNFVHDKSFSGTSDTTVEIVKYPVYNEIVNTIETKVNIYHEPETNILINMLNLFKKNKLEESKGKILIEFITILPNISIIKFKRKQISIFTNVCVLPIDEKNSILFWYFGQDFVTKLPIIDTIITNNMKRVLNEDIEILENLGYCENTINIKSDSIQKEFYKIINN